ncbi:phospholipase A2 [Streptomyces sp. NPDC005931]|uniref:phospholipase A2 n=1 Tax=Streptomyces sp. NPDC005931 TaxID=3364737 RepID=UPI0036AA9364
MNTKRLAIPGAALSGILLVTGVTPAVAASSTPTESAAPQVGAAVSKDAKLKKLGSITGDSAKSQERWFTALGQYQQGKAAIKRYRFDWKTDYCSMAPNTVPGGYDFSFSCYRHDFGYRNYKKLAGKKVFKNYHKNRIDKAFHSDMKRQCGKFFWADPYTPAQRKKLKAACLKSAKKYYEAVVAFG